MISPTSTNKMISIPSLQLPLPPPPYDYNNISLPFEERIPNTLPIKAQFQSTLNIPFSE